LVVEVGWLIEMSERGGSAALWKWGARCEEWALYAIWERKAIERRKLDPVEV